MFQTDKFIELIEEHPAVWNMSSKDYKDKNVREKSWEDIAECIVPSWDELKQNEKELQVRYLKNKWRHVRDNYSKYINQQQSGRSGVKKKKYLYADALYFLQQTVKKSRTTKKFENVDEEEGNDEESSSAEESLGKSHNVIREECGDEKSPKVKKFANISEHKLKTQEYQQKLLESLERHKTEHRDADEAFLMSLLPNIKKLSDEEKLDFRFHALQFFRDLNQKKKSRK